MFCIYDFIVTKLFTRCHIHVYDLISLTAEEETDGSQLDVESRLLLEFCEGTKTLIAIHSDLSNLQGRQDDETKSQVSLEDIVPCEDVKQSLSVKMPEHASKKVGFSDSENGINMADFLSAVEMHHGSKSSLRLKQLTPELLVKFGKFEKCLLIDQQLL